MDDVRRKGEMQIVTVEWRTVRKAPDPSSTDSSHEADVVNAQAFIAVFVLPERLRTGRHSWPRFASHAGDSVTRGPDGPKLLRKEGANPESVPPRRAGPLSKRGATC